MLVFPPKQAKAGLVVKLPSSLGLSTNLQGHWTFDAPNVSWGENKAFDSTSNKNHGILTNMATSTAPVAGKLGQALKFDGSNDSADVSPASSINDLGPLTISLWVKWNSLCTCHVISKTSSSNVGGYFLQRGTNDRYEFHVDYDGATNLQKFAGNSSVVLKEWAHIVVTWDGTSSASGVNIYKNAAVLSIVGTNDGAGSKVSDSSNNLTIGNRASGNNRPFDGNIDDVRVYNRALSAAEIKRLYTMGAGGIKVAAAQTGKITTNLLGHWTMDAQDINWNNGNTMDRSGNGNTGSFSGGMGTTTAPVVGKIAQALDFDGSNDSILAGDINAIDVASALTGCAWVKHGSITTDDMIMAKNVATDSGFLFFRDDTGSVSGRTDIYTVLVADSADTDSAQVEGATDSAKLGTWTHVCFSFQAGSDSGLRLYVNGVEDANSPVSVSSVNAINADANQFQIGSRSPGATAPFDGAIDEVRIYNRVLSRVEIRELYNQGVGAKVAAAQTNKITSGLVGNWTFDAPNVSWGENKAFDSSTNKYHGAINNMSTSTAPTIGKLGQALKFDGSDDYVNIGDVNALDGNSQLSVSYWLKPSALTIRLYHVTKANTAASDFGWAAHAGQNDGDDLEFRTTNAAVLASGATNTNILKTGQWYYVAMVYDGTQSDNAGRLKIYVDGVERALTFSGTMPSSLPSSTYSVRLGQTSNLPAGLYFDGSIDDVRVYNRALSAAEIQRLYQMGR